MTQKVKCTECFYGKPGKVCEGNIFTRLRTTIRGKQPAHYSGHLRTCAWFTSKNQAEQLDDHRPEPQQESAEELFPPGYTTLPCSCCGTPITGTTQTMKLAQRFRLLCVSCGKAVGHG